MSEEKKLKRIVLKFLDGGEEEEGGDEEEEDEQEYVTIFDLNIMDGSSVAHL